MKLLKPNWVSHDGNPIFSVDLHPDGSRFATGGQGDGGSSGKVVVWNTSPVLCVKDERDENVPKVLCVMDNHLACVNCVRWSCNGRFLASGGDDRIIMIWQFAGYGRAVSFGSSEPVNYLNGERWRCSHTLKKHTGDILQLAWSPADRWLASCSIDNTIVIWNAQKFPEVTAVLKGHTSLVKGVTWDPVGKYLASQSDDKSVKIWKTLDWKLETTITKPFEECGATTHILRLDWSPDGGYLVSAHAMNNSGPTAQIIERERWRTNMDFVGHRKAITCTRFNGRMFRLHPDKSSSKPRLPYTCCAIGSRDRSLSIWLTSLRRPLVVVNDLFEDSVMDISWSFAGDSLICCSWDGSVAYINFRPQEIGEPLSREEMNELHKKTYGKLMSIVSQPLVIENPAMLAIQQNKIEGKSKSFNKLAPGPVKSMKYPTKQVEVRTPTGKRRIIPVFVAPQEELGGVPRPFGSAAVFGSSNSLSSNLPKSPSKLNRSISSDKTVKKNENEKLNGSTSSSCSRLNGSNGNEKTGSRTSEKQKGDTPTKSISSNAPHSKSLGTSPVEKDIPLVGQKKVFLDNRLSEKSALSVPVEERLVFEAHPCLEHQEADRYNVCWAEKSVAQQSTAKNQQEKICASEKPSILQDDTLNKISSIPIAPPRPKKGGRPAGFTVKRKAGEDLSQNASPKQPKRIRKDQNIIACGHSKLTGLVSRYTTPLPVPPLSPEKLPARGIYKTLSMKIPDVGTDTSLKIHNDACILQSKHDNITSLALHKVVFEEGSRHKWESVLSSPGIALHASRDIVCVACADRTLHFFSFISGRRIIPIMTTQAKVHDIQCRGFYTMVISCDASLDVWDIKSMQSVVSHQSFVHILPSVDERAGISKKNMAGEHTVEGTSVTNTEQIEKGALQSCSVTDTGVPILMFINQKTYMFSKDMALWMLVNSPTESIEQCADYKVDKNNTLLKYGALRLLQKEASGVGAGALEMFHASLSSQQSATLALLECRVESCAILNSSSEYRYWMLAYIRHLVNEGLEVRLREICDEMLGPAHVKTKPQSVNRQEQATTWKPYIMDIFKRSLLRDEILPIIGSNLNFQRLYTEYQDQLEVCQGISGILPR